MKFLTIKETAVLALIFLGMVLLFSLFTTMIREGSKARIEAIQAATEVTRMEFELQKLKIQQNQK